MKVRLKKEIVTLGDAAPIRRAVGTYVEPEDWNALIAEPDTLRDRYPQRFRGRDRHLRRRGRSRITSFREFQDFAARQARSGQAPEDRDVLHRRHPLREGQRLSAVAQGFEEVYHLKGGILKYLEEVPESESRWQGECFVFDERVALGHGLRSERATRRSGDE